MPTPDRPDPAGPAGDARVGVVIAAAGESRRMGGVDKLFTPVLGKPLLAHAVDAFQSSPHVDAIVLVMRDELLGQGESLVGERGWDKVIEVVSGGQRRQDSVQQGLAALGRFSWGRYAWGRYDDWVMVHDGARPCVTQDVIARGLEAARETGGAIAAVPAKDTIKAVDRDRLVTDTPPREDLWQVQTPQVFRYDIIQAAYASGGNDATDDASLVERAGHRVKVFMGAYENIKVTTPEDLPLAELFLRRRAKE